MADTLPKSAVVCPSQTGSIYCPALKLLKITSAFYGKKQGRDCTGKVMTDDTPTCFARDTIKTIKGMCDGQQSCDLFSEPNLYGDTTCSPGAQKYLQVSYMCDGRSHLEQQLDNGKPGSNKIGECIFLFCFIDVYRISEQKKRCKSLIIWQERLKTFSDCLSLTLHFAIFG